MNDDLERMLNKPVNQPGLSRNPRLHLVPRVRGGPPLDGGPKLDVGKALGTEQKKPVHETGQDKRSQGGPHMQAPAPPAPATPEPEATAEAQAPRQSTPDRPLMHARNLTKSYQMGQVVVPVLRGVDLELARGEFLTIVGQSGSGKSTLLHLLGLLDAPDDGEVRFDGHRVDNLPSVQRDRLRNKNLGMIFQSYHLLPEFNALENVLAPLMIAHGAWNFWRQRATFRKQASDLLELVGLGHRLKHKPQELSGGEMQRTAIARALIAEPDMLLADEPTGNLDKETGTEILEILHNLNRQKQLTIVMVTHDRAIADAADRVVRLVDGRVEAT